MSSDSAVKGPSENGNFFILRCTNAVKTSLIVSMHKTSSPQSFFFSSAFPDDFLAKETKPSSISRAKAGDLDEPQRPLGKLSQF
jgi:hypothetical protein